MTWLEVGSETWIAVGAVWKATILLSALALQTLFPLLATYVIRAIRGRRPRGDGHRDRMRPGRFELPRPKWATRPSTLRVYQFRHRRVRRSV
jgi:hypothetical protein